MIPAVLPDIVAQHAIEVPLLLAMRRGLLDGSEADLADLAAHDRRITANLDGLALAGDVGMALAAEQFEKDADPDTAFAFTWLASQRQDRGAVERLLAAIDDTPRVADGAALALCWGGRAKAARRAASLLERENDASKVLALATYGLLGGTPPLAYDRLLEAAPPIRARAIAQAAWSNAVPAARLTEAREDDDPPCAFARELAAVLTGGGSAVGPKLRSLAAHDGPPSQLAQIVVGLATPAAMLREKVRAAEPDDITPALVRTAGYAGDPELGGWFVQLHAREDLEDEAEEALRRLTGQMVGDAIRPDPRPRLANPFDPAAPPPAAATAQDWWQGVAQRLGQGPHVWGQPVGQLAIEDVMRSAVLSDRAWLQVMNRLRFGAVPQVSHHAPARVQAGG